MNKEQAIRKLKKIQKNTDQEVAHYDADDVLCDLLCSLKCKDVIDEYVKIDKWYA